MEDTTETMDIENESADVGVYELGYHLVPTISEEQVPEAVGRIKEVLSDQGAGILAEEFPRQMRLAYTMERAVGGKRQKYDTSHFGWIKFDMEPALLEVVQAALRQNADVLRSLLVATTRETMPSGRVLSKPTETEASDAPALTDEELDKTIEEMVKE